MSAPYVPAVFVAGQPEQQQNNPQQPSAYGQARVAGQQNHNPTLHQASYGQASQPYVPGQAQTLPQATSPYGQAYAPGQIQPPPANNYSAHAHPHQQQMQAYAPGHGVPHEQRGAYDPDDPHGERGLLKTGGKIALGVGAAAVAYTAYNRFQHHQQTQQPPQQYAQSQQYPQDPQPPQFNPLPPQHAQSLQFQQSQNTQQQQQQYNQFQQFQNNQSPQQQQGTYGGAQPPAFEQPQRKGVLTIYLDRLANLANKDLLSKSDPYVKLSIEQDNWIRDLDHGQQISARKHNDLNPVYDEVFHFNLPTLRNMVLRVQVMDDDGGLTSDDKMGACKLKLWELGLTAAPKPVERVIDRNVLSSNGTCHLRLAYSG